MAFNLDEYTPVSERIKQFWIDHPNGAIHSELVFDDGSRCVVKTVLWLDKDDTQPTTTDYAEELLTDRGVNSMLGCRAVTLLSARAVKKCKRCSA